MLSHREIFSFPIFFFVPPPNLQAHYPASRRISRSQGPNSSLEGQIPTSRPKSLLQGPLSLERCGPQDWDLGFEAGIWALRLSNRPGGWWEGGRRRRRRRRRRKKFPCVKALVIDPFRAAALLPPSTLIMIYLSTARVPLTT